MVTRAPLGHHGNQSTAGSPRTGSCDITNTYQTIQKANPVQINTELFKILAVNREWRAESRVDQHFLKEFCL